MNLFRVFLSFHLILSLSFLFTRVVADEMVKSKYSSISRLAYDGKLSLKIRGAGGHTGECIEMLLRNNSPDTLFVRIEPGRMLESQDTTVQDILITREEMIVLAPGEQSDLIVFGFCGQALNSSPDSAQAFNIGDMADSVVVLLAEFLDERNNNFPEDAIQSAVWCLTDDHDIMDIYRSDMESISELAGFVAGLKGIDWAEIFVDEIPSDDNTFSNYSKTITGKVELFIPADCKVDIFVCDQEGQRYITFKDQVLFKAGQYTYSFEFTASNWPPGKYYFIIKNDLKELFNREIEL